jgi:hypothetical protein
MNLRKLCRVQDTDLTGKWVKATEVSTGKPITLSYVRSTNKSPTKYKRFAQDIEPHGTYLSNNPGKDKIPTLEYGEITFNKPYVLEHNGTDANGWKGELVKTFKKKGKALSQAMIAQGYDAIITVNSNSNVLEEIVSLKDFNPNYKDRRKLIDSARESFDVEAASLQDIAEYWANKGKGIASFFLKTLKRNYLIGMKVEREHTDNPAALALIVKQHLIEDPNYYIAPKPYNWGVKEAEND